MKFFTPFFAVSVAAIQFGFAVPAMAFDLDGAWTTETDMCSKVFSRAGNVTSFAPDADEYVNGFIVEGNSIRGKTAKCTVKARKEAGAVTHLIAVCSSAIMIDQTQLSFKVVDDNKIVRLFPGMETFETTYVRCPLAHVTASGRYHEGNRLTLIGWQRHAASGHFRRRRSEQGDAAWESQSTATEPPAVQPHCPDRHRDGG